MTPDQAIKSHMQHCNCKPFWINTDTGQALICAKETVLIWWPTVVTTELNQAQQMALFVVGPMAYDSDGYSANNILLRAGYNEVNQANFNKAKKALISYYEEDLWRDNVAKQLLGRIADNDLEGE